MKITVEVTINELNALERIATCWNLCDKHKGEINATEEEMFAFTQTCPECLDLNRKLDSKALHLWSKLLTAYLAARKIKY